MKGGGGGMAICVQGRHCMHLVNSVGVQDLPPCPPASLDGHVDVIICDKVAQVHLSVRLTHADDAL